MRRILLSVSIASVALFAADSFTQRQRDFWSFQKIASPAPPDVRNRAWVRNAIDQFVLAKLEGKGIAPAPEADKVTLLRRATLDLTGLVPTPEEIDAFVADRSP